MKIDSQALEGHQVKLVVEFEEDTVETFKRRAARDIAGKIKVPGFRPGKAPYNVVLRQVGEPYVLEAAIEKLVEERYQQIIDEASIKPYGAGQVDNIASTEPLVLEFVVSLEPEVALGDYHALRRAYEPPQIGPADIENTLDNLRQRAAVVEPVHRPAAAGDVVSARLSGTRLNPGEDQEQNLIQENVYQFRVREESDNAQDEWPFPGFSSELIGMSAGDGQTLNYTFADDYELEGLRGAQASYQVTIEEVKSRTLPELNDDFARTVGEQWNTLDELKVDIQKDLETQSLSNYNQSYDDALIEELVEQSSIKYPPQMVESEQNSIVDNFQHRLEHQGSTLDVYLKTRNLDLAAFKEETRPLAEERLKRSLVLLEVSKAENIEISEEELSTETQNLLLSLNQSLSPEEARRLTDQRILNNLIGNVMLDLHSRHAQQRLRDIASGVYQPDEANPEEPVAESSPGEDEAIAETAPDPEKTVAETSVSEIEAAPPEE